jgi:hypothetical protein
VTQQHVSQPTLATPSRVKPKRDKELWRPQLPEDGEDPAKSAAQTIFVLQRSDKTGNPLTPAWYWVIAMVVGLIAVAATRESAPTPAAGTFSA